MRSKIFVIVAAVMLITASFAVVAAQETPKELKGKRLLHRYHVAYHHAEQLRIGMEAVIDYMGDANAGKLEIIKGDFVAKEGELKTAAENNDFKGFQSTMADMRGLVKDFKTEAHALLENKVGEAQTMVAKALQENREYLNSLVMDINKARKDSDLEELDKSTKKVDERLNKTEKKGVNTSALREKLKEVKDKRVELKTKLEAAVESCKGIGLGRCDTLEAQEYNALKKEIREDFKDLKNIARDTGQRNKIKNSINAARKVVDGLGKRITAAEERGIDVTVIKAEMEEVKRIIDSAEEKFYAGDNEGAITELKNAKQAFKSVVKEFSKTIRPTKKEEKEEETSEESEEELEELEKADEDMAETGEEVEDEESEEQDTGEDSETGPQSSGGNGS